MKVVGIFYALKTFSVLKILWILLKTFSILKIFAISPIICYVLKIYLYSPPCFLASFLLESTHSIILKRGVFVPIGIIVNSIAIFLGGICADY